jgi:uncharacterized membrane protein (DUF106 family)
MEDQVMMIVFAVLLLVVAAVLIVAAVAAGGEAVTTEVFTLGIEAPLWSVFLAGAVTILIAVAGAAALTIGIRQVQAHRKEIEYLRQRVAEQDQAGNPTGSSQATKVEKESASNNKRKTGKSATPS